MHNTLFRWEKGIRDYLRIPFFNNALSIIGIQAATTILGFVFWVLVTRLFTTEQVGLGTGIYSAAILLVSLAELGFGDGLTYYLPRVANPNRLINAYFSVSGLVVLIFTGAFLLGQRIFSLGLDIVLHSPLALAAFSICTLLIHLGLLQDTLFTADRVAKYGLPKNIIASLLRFPAFAVLLFTREWDLILSAAVSLAIGMLLVGRQYRRLERPALHYGLEFAPQIWTPILGFSFGNYLVNTLLALPGTLLPLMVLNQLGSDSNGYFYVAWMLSSFLAVIGRSLGTSLFVESGRDFGSIGKNTLRSLIISSAILLPAVLSLVVFSQQILLIFGRQYSLEAQELVILLSISCIPLTYSGIAVGVLKSQARIKELLGLAVIFTGMHLGIAFYLMNQTGLKGVGAAVLIARTISALLAFILAFRDPITVVGRNMRNKLSKTTWVL